MRPRRYVAEQYPGLLTADPPVCGVGPALGLLRRCERLRRSERCYCRFAAGDITDDLTAAGIDELAEYFSTSLEPEDVEELVGKLSRLDLTRVERDVGDRLALELADLRRLVQAGSGLTDRYADDLD